MGAFSVINPAEQALPLPAICKSCGGAAKSLYLDTGTSENDYGAILYCIDCVGDFAHRLGFVSPENATEIRRLAEEQYLQSISLRARAEKLEGVINDLVVSGYRNDSIDFIELDLVLLDSLINSDSPKRTDSMESREVEPIEQVNVQRMDDLPASAGPGFKLFDS